MAEESGISSDFQFVATHLIYAWADAFLYRPITMQRSNFRFLSNDRTNIFGKTRVINAETYSQRLEQEGRLDALKLDYPKKDLSLSKLRTNQISS